MMYGVVVAKTNSFYENLQSNSKKIVSTLKKSDGEIIHMFYLPTETEQQSTLMNEQYTAVGANSDSPCG